MSNFVFQDIQRHVTVMKMLKLMSKSANKQIPSVARASVAVPTMPEARSVAAADDQAFAVASADWAQPVYTFTDYVLGTKGRRTGHMVSSASFSTNNNQALVSLPKVSNHLQSFLRVTLLGESLSHSGKSLDKVSNRCCSFQLSDKLAPYEQ